MNARRTLSKTGRHLIVDGFGDPEILRNQNYVKYGIAKVVRLAGMQLLDCHAYAIPEDERKMGRTPFEDSGGVTAYAVLTTSHASIHTFPLLGEFRFDLYSCRNFDPVRVEQFVLATFQGVSSEVRNFER